MKAKVDELKAWQHYLEVAELAELAELAAIAGPTILSWGCCFPDFSGAIFWATSSG
jgi:hypothetical protein